jgi:protein-ribulosamine 3-kinase
LNLEFTFSERLNEDIKLILPLSGGSINTAYKVETDSGNNYFVKINYGPSSESIFQSELRGLEILSAIENVSIPKPILLENNIDHSILILEYIDALIKPDFAEWENAAETLSRIHSTKSTKFGLDHNNYIGSLRQLNTPNDNWIAFFGLQRLHYQIERYKVKGNANNSTITLAEKLIERLSDFLPNIQPALLHGDFWRGNLILGKGNKTWFIDPAIYYGHSEVDLAMSKLFGGFPGDFYQCYFTINPPEPGIAERINIYQLYYLLVHLNIFGNAYLQGINRRLKQLV